MRDPRSYRERLYFEARRLVQENWRWVVYPCQLVGLLTAIRELFRFKTPIEEIPYLLLSGPILGVQYMTLFVVAFAYTMSAVTYSLVDEALVWRFRIVAVIRAATVFLVLMTAWVLLVFHLPYQFEPIRDALADLYVWFD